MHDTTVETGSLNGFGDSGFRWCGPFLKPGKIQAVIKNARETRGVPVGVEEGYQIAEIARRMLESKRRMEKHRRALEEDGEHLPAVRVAEQVLGPVTMAVLYLAVGEDALCRRGQPPATVC